MIGRERFGGKLPPARPKPQQNVTKTPPTPAQTASPALPPTPVPEPATGPFMQEQAEVAKTAGQKARKARQREKQRAKEQARLDGRLPHGARFEVQYDALGVLWEGRLIIPLPRGYPGEPPLEEVFTGDASALFTLLVRLDRQYRKYLAAQTAPEPPEETPQ